jgi:hypothetical protein
LINVKCNRKFIHISVQCMNGQGRFARLVRLALPTNGRGSKKKSSRLRLSDTLFWHLKLSKFTQVNSFRVSVSSSSLSQALPRSLSLALLPSLSTYPPFSSSTSTYFYIQYTYHCLYVHTYTFLSLSLPLPLSLFLSILLSSSVPRSLLLSLYPPLSLPLYLSLALLYYIPLALPYLCFYLCPFLYLLLRLVSMLAV